MGALRFAEILGALVRHDVEFIVVGGLAAVLLGVPISTLDVDVVYARTPDNIARLLAALRELGAVFRTDPRRIEPNASHLASAGHKLLETRFGVLDVLGAIEQSTGYDELLPDSEWLEVAGLNVRVISLERLIRVKEQLTRPKDVNMLLHLRATLDELRRAGRLG